MVEEFRLPTDLIIGQLVGGVGAGYQGLIHPRRAGSMGGAAVRVEAAGPKALRVGVVEHGIRGDMPGQVRAALEAGLGVVEILFVEVVIVGETSAGRCALLEAV